MKIFRSLFWKFFLVLWLVNLLMIIASTYFVLGVNESQHFKLRHRDNVERIAMQIINRYERGMSLHFPESRRLPPNRNNRIGKLVISDEMGQLIYGESFINNTERHTLELNILSDSGKRYTAVNLAGPQPKFVPPEMRRFFAWRGLIMIISSALISLILTLLITRPLKQLGKHSRSLAAGDLEVRVEEKLIRRGDEIGRLAREFNDMAGKISETIDSKQQLLHDVSHELRAPLARLQAAAAINQQRSKGQDPEMHQRIERECQRMDCLIQQILDYARMDQYVDTSDALDLKQLLKGLIDDVSFEYNDRKFTLNLPENDIVIQGNEEFLHRAIENILRNACRHTPTGSGIEITLFQQEGNSILKIRDYGSGIENKDLDKLFKPFYRSDNAMHTEGFGLGLSIASRAIEKHRGVIVARNHSSGGLELIITLPPYIT